MIFYRKGVRKVTKKGTEIMYDIDKKIDFSVFPGMQARPLVAFLAVTDHHNHQAHPLTQLMT